METSNAEGEHSKAPGSPSQPQSRVFARVYPLVVLSFLGSGAFGILTPVLPILLTEYFARVAAHGAPIDCGATPHAQICVEGSKRAAWLSSVFSAIGSVLLIFLSPLIGHASDVYGRKIFLLVSQLLGIGGPLAAIYFSEQYGSIAPYYTITLVTSAFGTDGVAGAAAADCVRPSKRAAAFGYIFAAAVVGFCAAAFVSPFLSRLHSLYVAEGIALVKVAWVAIVLRETLPAERRTNDGSSGISNPLSSMAILFRSRLFICLSGLIALSSCATTGLLQIQFYFLNVVIGFDSKDLARLMLLGAVAGIAGQGLLLQPLVNRVRERGVIIAAFLDNFATALASVFVAGFYLHKWVIFAMVPAGILSNLSFPAISALKSMNISEKEQGRLQGAIYGARALFDAIGAIIYGRLYGTMKTGSTVSRMAPYILSTCIYLAGTVVAVLLPSSRRPRSAHGGEKGRQDGLFQWAGDSKPDSMAEPLLGDRRNPRTTDAV